MQDKENLLKLGHKLIKKHKLGMKLLNVSLDEECCPVFFFSAPTRIDFRALVADLNRELNTKVALRQVGARDEAKYIGGLGICGRKLCCSSWLPCVPNVPTKLIQKQNLQGSPGRYTGVCGKLLCCLAYETGDLKFEKVGDVRCGSRKREGEKIEKEGLEREGLEIEEVVGRDDKGEEKPKPKKKAPVRRVVRRLRLKKK